MFAVCYTYDINHKSLRTRNLTERFARTLLHSYGPSDWPPDLAAVLAQVEAAAAPERGTCNLRKAPDGREAGAGLSVR